MYIYFDGALNDFYAVSGLHMKKEVPNAWMAYWILLNIKIYFMEYILIDLIKYPEELIQ